MQPVSVSELMFGSWIIQIGRVIKSLRDLNAYPFEVEHYAPLTQEPN